MQYKSVPAEFKALDETAGVVDILFSTYESAPDSYGDVIEKGAFSKAIALSQAEPRKHMPYLAWSHDWQALPLGHITSLNDSDRGPVATCQFDMEDEFAAKVYRKIKTSQIREASFGFDVEQEDRDSKAGTNRLKSVFPLYEVSPVMIGANRDTQMLSIRSREKAGIVQYERLPAWVKLEAHFDAELRGALGIRDQWDEEYVAALTEPVQDARERALSQLGVKAQKSSDDHAQATTPHVPAPSAEVLIAAMDAVSQKRYGLPYAEFVSRLPRT